MDLFKLSLNALALPIRGALRLQARVQHVVERTAEETFSAISQRAFEKRVREEQMALDHLEEQGQCCICHQQGQPVPGKRKKDGGMKLLEGHDALVVSAALGTSVRGYLCPTCDVIRTKLKNRLIAKQQEEMRKHGGAASAAADKLNPAAHHQYGAAEQHPFEESSRELSQREQAARATQAAIVAGGCGMGAGPLAKSMFRGVTAWPTSKPLDIGIVAPSSPAGGGAAAAAASSGGALASGITAPLMIGMSDSVALTFRAKRIIPTVSRLPAEVEPFARAQLRRVHSNVKFAASPSAGAASAVAASAPASKHGDDDGDESNPQPRSSFHQRQRSSSSNFDHEIIARQQHFADVDAVEEDDDEELGDEFSVFFQIFRIHHNAASGEPLEFVHKSEPTLATGRGAAEWVATPAIPIAALCGSDCTGTFLFECFYSTAEENRKIGACKFRMEDVVLATTEEVGPVDLLSTTGELRGLIFLQRVVIHRLIVNIDYATGAGAGAGAGAGGGARAGVGIGGSSSSAIVFDGTASPENLTLPSWAVTALRERKCDLCHSRNVEMYHARYRDLVCHICKSARRHAKECVAVGAPLPDLEAYHALTMTVLNAERPTTRDDPAYHQPLSLFPDPQPRLVLQQRSLFGGDLVVEDADDAEREKRLLAGAERRSNTVHFSEADGLLAEATAPDSRRLKAETLFAGRKFRSSGAAATADGDGDATDDSSKQPDLFDVCWQATPLPKTDDGDESQQQPDLFAVAAVAPKRTSPDSARPPVDLFASPTTANRSESESPSRTDSTILLVHESSSADGEAVM